VTWPAGETLWRVSRDPAGTEFSTSDERSHRFSPLLAADGSVVPAWYGATSQAGAIFESVFHDIRPSHREPRVMPNAYVERVLAQVVTARPLALVDLTTVGLHRIGTTRTALIESTSRSYAWTVEQALILRAAAPHADGFMWVSRAHDTSRCVVLYGDRGDPAMLAPGSDPALPLALGTGLELLRKLADAAAITIVSPEASS
jgi:hypothetical protein